MKPMLFSVSYAGLWGQHVLDVNTFIQKAAALGYESVELMCKRPHLSVLDTSEEDMAAIKKCARDASIKIGTLAAYTDFTGGLQAREVPFIEMQVHYVRTLARAASILGAKIIRVFTGYTTDPESYNHDWTTCVKAIRECADTVKEYDVILGIQNHHDTGVAHESYIEFLTDVDRPNCKAMFDPWAPALHGDDLYECARTMAPHMAQTTLADYVKLRRFKYMPGLVNYAPLPDMVRAVALGEGFIDYEAFFAGLKEGGFSGYAAYEMCSPLRGGGSEENLDAAATTSLSKIREWADFSC